MTTTLRNTARAFALAALPVLAAAQQPAAAKVDSETISGLGARNIGSAAMSGRIAAVAAVHEGTRLTVYAGAASGGVWKSTNGGTTFKAVFDKEPVQSIGAITIDPRNPKVIWVGTGESWMRNSVSVGTGVYKTTDGGGSWKQMGLEDSEHIASIAVDPKQSDTVYVCAAGHLWSSNEQRGVFKTADGGKTWKKVLYVDADTGCSDIGIDPEMPNVLYAGMWQMVRHPWMMDNGGPGSAIYRSIDGGSLLQFARHRFDEAREQENGQR